MGGETLALFSVRADQVAGDEVAELSRDSIRPVVLIPLHHVVGETPEMGIPGVKNFQVGAHPYLLQKIIEIGRAHV